MDGGDFNSCCCTTTKVAEVEMNVGFQLAGRTPSNMGRHKGCDGPTGKQIKWEASSKTEGATLLHPRDTLRLDGNPLCPPPPPQPPQKIKGVQPCLG